MKDALGNVLESGHLVLWNNMVAKVTAVNDGQLSIVKKGEGEAKVPPSITLEIKLFNPQPGAVIRVVDPAASAIIDKAMGAH